MAYPQVSHTGDGHSAASRRARRFPQIEEAVLAYWADDDTFRASVDAARRGRGRRQRVRLLRRPAVRQRAAALRPPADRLRQGPGAALPDHARPPRRAPLRLGHPRPAGRARGDAPARHEDDRGDPRARHREVQRGVPQVGLRVHRGVARLRHPPGPLGRLRQRLQDPRPPDYMESVMWAFKQLHDKGLAYEGFRVLPYCWNDETPLSNHELRMDDDVYQQRVDPAVTVGLRLTSGPAEGALALVWTTTPWTLRGQPRGHGRPRHRLRRGRVGLHRDARSGTCSRRPGWRRTPRSWARSPDGRRSG